MIQYGYAPRHVDPTPTRLGRWSRQLAAGAVIGFGLLLPFVVASPAEAAPSQVTVVRGNTLSGLAHRWCGSASRYVSLAAGNGIANPNRIFIGQKIKLTCSAPARTTGNTASRSTTRTTSVPSTGAWAYPLSSRGSCSSPYGMRHMAGRAPAFHYGQDIAAPFGRPILAAAAGTVVQAGANGGYGNSVTIRHGGTTYTLYGHSSRVLVRVGQTVQRGQQIALTGHSGDATGNHVHVEVWTAYKVRTNPASYFAARGVRLC